MLNKVCQNLNEHAKIVGCADAVVFHAGGAVNIVARIAPYGKAAVIYRKASFSEFGKSFTERLKASGLKALNFIMPDDVRLDFENVFEVIGVPDDVRAIVFFDREISNLAAYIATVLNIPAVCVLRTLNTRGALAPKAWFYGGGLYEPFTVRCVRHIIFDDEFFSETDKAEQYVNITEKLVALTDYRVRHEIFGGKTAKEAYAQIKKSVLAVFDVGFSENVAETLLTEGFKIETADFISGGAIVNNSSLQCFKRLTGFREKEGLNFTLLKTALKLYALLGSIQDDPFAVPDYNVRATELAEITGSDDGVFMQGILRQLRYLKTSKTKPARLRSSFSEELNIQEKALSGLEKTYSALGGKTDADFSPYVKAFKLSGDLPGTMNFMTLAREGGFTENL